MPTPAQQDLFSDDPLTPAAPPPSPPGQALLKVPGSTASLSKAQKEFNRLNERLARLRDQLAAWQATGDALNRRRLTQLVPKQQALRAAQRETVLWIDAHLQRPPPGERLAKKARAKLVALLRLLAQAVLEDGPDAEVEAAHDRHSAQDWRERQRLEVDLAAAMLGRACGDEALFAGEAESLEELLARAAQRMRQQDAQAAAEPAAPSPDRRPGRAEKARLRDEKTLQEASRSVRDVYRRLARDLHPDRESDAAARDRKTALMARANQAYAAGDLLALLAMQLELEQLDADHLAGLPDDRLRHYNRVLKEQQQSLEDELALLQAPVSAALQRPPGLLNWPAKLLVQAFEEELDDVGSALRAIREDVQLLRDARTRADFLRAVEIEDPDDGLSPMESMMLNAMLDELRAGPSPARGNAGRKRRPR